MKKLNPTRRSSAVGEAWMHAMFKVKYCHDIFDYKEVREECSRLFDEASEKYDIPIDGRGFDANHVHMKVDVGNYSRPQVAKMFKGYVARKLLQRFPWLKKKYFWGSGLWNPSYHLGSPKSLDWLDNYLKKQKYFDPCQTQLTLY